MSFATLKLNLSGRSLDLSIGDVCLLQASMTDRAASCREAAENPYTICPHYWQQEAETADRLYAAFEELLFDRVEPVGADIDERVAKLEVRS